MESFLRVSTGSDTVVVDAAPLLMRGYYFTNTNLLSFRYVHFFDRTGTAGGMNNVLWTVALPSESGSNVSWENGIEFENGLVIAYSTSPSSIVAVASEEVVGNIFYDETV